MSSTWARYGPRDRIWPASVQRADREVPPLFCCFQFKAAIFLCGHWASKFALQDLRLSPEEASSSMNICFFLSLSPCMATSSGLSFCLALHYPETNLTFFFLEASCHFPGKNVAFFSNRRVGFVNFLCTVLCSIVQVCRAQYFCRVRHCNSRTKVVVCPALGHAVSCELSRRYNA